SQPQSHPRRVLLPFRARPADTPLRVFHVGAPPPVRKRTPARTPSQPQSHPGRVLLRLRARPGDTPLRVFPVGAPPPVRKRTPAITPSQPQSHPGRVLLRLRACPGLLAAAGVLCRSTAPGAKADPSQNPEPAPNRTRGGRSYRSERAPGYSRLGGRGVGAP